jgi:Fe-S-cluster-containing dehydrogenase component
MMNSLYIDASKCTGCLQCEMACSYENYGVFAPAKSRIKVDFPDMVVAVRQGAVSGNSRGTPAPKRHGRLCNIAA